jgi:N-methylhydantoinase A
VTDSAFVLGLLGEGKLAGGITLNSEAARNALVPVAEQLGFEIEDVARGVMTITAANMANAIREITIERGQDPRGAKLMAFGGAGPLFGTLLAKELEIAEIVIPPYAGNFSAWGLLGSDLTRTAALTRIMKLSGESIEQANSVLADLFAGLEARANGGSGDSRREVGLDMRYAGQEHTLTISLPSEGGSISVDADEVHELFTRDYSRTFDLTMEEEVEIVSTRATLRTALPRRAAEAGVASLGAADRTTGSVEAYSFTRGEWLPFDVVERQSLAVGSELEGPAIVLEETATTCVDAGYVARVDESSCLFLRRGG